MEHFGHLLLRETSEVPQFDDPALAVVQGGEVPFAPVGLTLLPKPLVQVAVLSEFVERPTAQSTSWSIVTLK